VPDCGRVVELAASLRGDSVGRQRPEIRKESLLMKQRSTKQRSTNRRSTALAAIPAPQPTHTTAEIAALAYALWRERGCPEGSPEKDWYQAQRLLAERKARTKASKIDAPKLPAPVICEQAAAGAACLFAVLATVGSQETLLLPQY